MSCDFLEPGHIAEGAKVRELSLSKPTVVFLLGILQNRIKTQAPHILVEQNLF